MLRLLTNQKIPVRGITDPFIQTYSYDDLNRLSSATETNDSDESGLFRSP